MKAKIFERARLSNHETVTLYDWVAEDVKDGRNLIATNRSGMELWRATPVLSDDPAEDCFTGIQWDGVTLTASTWSGYKVSVDPDTGAVTVLAFTK